MIPKDEKINTLVKGQVRKKVKFICRLHTLVSERMIIFNKGLKPLLPEYRAESDLATDDTFSNPAMTYYYKEVADPRGNTETVQGFNGLQYWLSGDPSPELDRYAISFQGIGILG